MVWTGGPASAESGRQLVDIAAEAGLDFVHFNGMSGKRYFAEIVGSGAALFDYDNDGDLDLYVVQSAMLGSEDSAQATFPPQGRDAPPRDRLFRNDLIREPGEPRARPRFVDVTSEAGIEALGYGVGVAAGDIDNDGWTDLYVTNLGANQLWRNNGDGTFSDATAPSGTAGRQWSVSAAFADYDRDGWLDLYVANYVEYRLAIDKACVSATGVTDYCGPLAYAPEADKLYRNRGDGTFEEASLAAGLDAETPRSGLGVVAGDFNLDGWIDLYVANDQMPNLLWVNQRDGTFVNEALLAGCAVSETGMAEASMGVVVGDFDDDADEDLFMTHLTRETNTLYVNDGSGFFEDRSRASGLGTPSFQHTGFGVVLADLDLDGLQDLYVANGAVRVIEELARTGDVYPLEQPDLVFRNLGGARFQDASADWGEVLARTEVGRGVTAGDVDLDGDPDLVTVNNSGPLWLLENRGGEEDARHWISGRFLVAPGGRDAYGSRMVEASSEGLRSRRIGTDGSYASATAPAPTVGLGESAAPREIRTSWLGGGETVWRGLPVDRHYVFVRDPEPASD